jgi:ammonia channel protein AmtB
MYPQPVSVVVGMLIGIFATKAVNAAGNDGWFYGSFSFSDANESVADCSSYSFIVSWHFKFINFLLPIRVSRQRKKRPGYQSACGKYFGHLLVNFKRIERRSGDIIVNCQLFWCI